MKGKSLTVLALIFAIVQIAMVLISGSDRFDITIPWFVMSLPSSFFFLFILLPRVVRGERKNNKDGK